MKKQLPTAKIANELTGASVFFHAGPRPAPPAKPGPLQHQPAAREQDQSSPSAPPAKPGPPLPRPVVKPPAPVPTEATKAERKEVTPDVTTDVMTSLLHDVNKKLWREFIEETETHNSSLRLSLKEREQIEDLVRDLKRKYRIKTSMNEIARLGLLFLMHDFKKRGIASIITEVKTS